MRIGWILIGLGSCSLMFDLDAEEADSKKVRMTWTWGLATRPVMRATTVGLAFPNSGVIKVSGTNECLYIELVKRPPAILYPIERPFCQRFLPVAIQWFAFENDIALKNVLRMEVLIDAEPAVAACKCYLRTMASFGFTKILGAKETSTRAQQDKFCETVVSNELRFVLATRPQSTTLVAPPYDDDAWSELLQIVPIRE